MKLNEILRNAGKQEWNSRNWKTLVDQATRQTLVSKVPLAWVLEYQPKVRLPGKGIIGYDPFWCQQQLLADTAKFRHLNKARQLGFTTTFAIEAVWDMAYTPQAEIVVLSKSEKEAKKFIDKFYVAHESVVGKDPDVPRLTTQNTKNAIAENGATLDVITSSKGSGRSFSATSLYFDEMAHTMYADDIYQSAIPTISVTEGRITTFSTPKGRSNKFAQIGKNPEDFGFSPHEYAWWFSPFYNGYYQKFLEAFQADDVEKVKHYIEKARKHKKYLRLRKSFSGSQLAFEQEFECRYDASINNVFSQDQLKKMFKPMTKFKGLVHQETYPFTDQMWTSRPNKDHHYFTGIDLGRKRDATVVVTFDLTEKPARLVEYKRIPPATADWHLINLAIRDTYDKFKPEMVHDATSMSGDAVSEMLIDISDPQQINNNVARTGKKYNMVENLRRGADESAFIMPKIPQLYREFEEYEWDDKSIVQDSVMAVALAVYEFYQPNNVWTGAVNDFSYIEGNI